MTTADATFPGFPGGIHVPLVTPFAADGSVDAGALESLAHDLLDRGATGLVALGTTGEPAALDPAERRLVTDTAARVCRERSARLTVGVTTNDTRAAAEEIRALAALPSPCAALVPVPYFTRPTEDGVVAHYAHVTAAAPDVPVIVYNIPYRTGRTVGQATIRRLAALPGVAGIKQAVGAVDADTVALLADPPPGFAVLAGDDAFAPALLALGAAGGILASAHLATESYVRLLTAWRDGDMAHARALGGVLTGLATAAFAEPNPTVVKGVLHAQGRIPTAAVRLPLLPASPAAVEAAARHVHILADRAGSPALASLTRA
ncbi:MULTISPECIES: dihydrodipicolinate synthase family protein [Streptomycetaceae]|nr:MULTISPECIES: dihydrodipicolinate synthase family protein [Streptomycetaceae]MYS59490.1 4-hydroxy-tetrahydrodipicolinate synthase [Streptomyces sp. SID5468]CCB75225.1 Dihydrodipicolinate synthase [Streptantibioticus cattleyicolor NRRL 8057 = DSM 46488]